MADKATESGTKPFWDIEYSYEDPKARPKKPVLGIVPPVARGTQDHESEVLTAREREAIKGLPREKSNANADDLTRITTTPLIPGVPPEK